MVSNEELVSMSKEAKGKAYAPYSKFRVGAALVSVTGEIFLGCNIENVSYSPTICAERTAFVKAVSEGNVKFSKIAISTDAENLSFPCGVCRQFMTEFCDEEFQIIISNNKESKSFTFGEIFPHRFILKD